MTKDRLKALQSVVQESEDDFEGLNFGMVNTIINIDDENAGYMECFLNEIANTRDWIKEIKENVSVIKSLHSTLLSSPRPDENIKLELESRSETVKQLSKKVSHCLKELEGAISKEEEELEPNARITAGLRIRKTQHSASLHLFVEAMSQFNTEQVNYKEKCEERIQRVISIAKAVVTDEKIEELLEQGNYGSIFSGDIITETLEVKRALEDVQTRHQELLSLEKSIQELRDLFLEMSILVNQQGELINRIEKHVMEAGEHIETTIKEITLAEKYQRKAKTKKIFIIVGIIVLILLAIILTYVFWPKAP